MQFWDFSARGYNLEILWVKNGFHSFRERRRIFQGFGNVFVRFGTFRLHKIGLGILWHRKSFLGTWAQNFVSSLLRRRAMVRDNFYFPKSST